LAAFFSCRAASSTTHQTDRNRVKQCRQANLRFALIERRHEPVASMTRNATRTGSGVRSIGRTPRKEKAGQHRLTWSCSLSGSGRTALYSDSHSATTHRHAQLPAAERGSQRAHFACRSRASRACAAAANCECLLSARCAVPPHPQT
jgi:hypothetical protein